MHATWIWIPTEGKREHQIPWSWVLGSRELGTKLGFSSRAELSLTISSAPTLIFEARSLIGLELTNWINFLGSEPSEAHRISGSFISATPAFELGVPAVMPGCLCGFWEWSTGPHACEQALY